MFRETGEVVVQTLRHSPFHLSAVLVASLNISYHVSYHLYHLIAAKPMTHLRPANLDRLYGIYVSVSAIRRAILVPCKQKAAEMDHISPILSAPGPGHR
jgi:hypothetical protein